MVNFAAAHTAGNGRAVYFAGFRYSPAFARVLHRSILWAAGKERLLNRWHCADYRTECAAYPATGKFVVINNCDTTVETLVYNNKGHSIKMSLQPHQSVWKSIETFETKK